MHLSAHADRTEKEFGIRAEDIHKWIDGLFDADNFDVFLSYGKQDGYDPYDHRKYRHCQEAIKEAYEEFKGKYTKEQIKSVFECHIKDDYNGYLPTRADFENGTFKEKYHDNEDRTENERILSQKELTEYFKGKAFNKKSRFSSTLSKGFVFRIIIPTFIAIALFVTSIFIVVMPVFRNNMIDRKKEMIKELTATSISLVNHYINLEQTGEMDKEEAQKIAAEQINGIRYGDENKDYFWITDMSPKMIVHPYRTDLVGKDLSEYRDTKTRGGKKLFVEFVNIVKENEEGYLEYFWQWKDDASQHVPKLSFVKGIPEWNWIIGTGVYINDVEDEINRLRGSLLLVFSFISLGLIIILLNVIYQSHNIESDRLNAETGLIEAKDRYRALVEASNEGHLLEINGDIIYSNLTLQKMLGFNDEELIKKEIWEVLKKNSTNNENALSILKEIKKGKTPTKPFEAQLETRNGKIIEVIVTISRIFFSKKNGHVISFRPIIHKSTDNVFNNFESGQNLSSKLFSSQKTGNICHKIPDDEIEKFGNEKIFVKENTPAFIALKELIASDKNQLLVKDKKGNPIGIIDYKDFAKEYAGLPLELLLEIENSNSTGHVINTLNRLPLLIREMVGYGAKPDALRGTIGRMFDAAIVKFIQLSLNTLGEPPVSFAFITLGSNARHEMTMFSDQDNALIFNDVQENDLQRVRRYFLKLADGVCAKLDKAGYPFCPGGIMAVNPKYCLSISEWKDCFTDWITNATPESILEVNIFLDIFCPFGDHDLVNDLMSHIMKLTSENPQFFIYFAKNCLTYKAPLNLLGHIKTETRDGLKTINIKENLKPLEILARIYALKLKITKPGSVSRLRKIIETENIKKDSFQEMIYVFDYLWRIRFSNQINSHADLRSVNDELDLNTLSSIERQNLRNVLSLISDFQTKLSFDFLGGDRFS